VGSAGKAFGKGMLERDDGNDLRKNGMSRGGRRHIS
jgi:hypothetical protein